MGRADLLQLLFEWLVLMPARALAFIAIVPVASLPAVAAICTWFWVIRAISGKDDGKPANPTTFVLAVVLSGYVLLVTGIAIFYYFIHSEWLSGD
jgi:uncharacterized membrane protein YidH (DUF202 family)